MAQSHLAFVAIVKNEAHLIFDWLAHHAALSVDHFYIYDNASTDSTVEEIRSFPNQRQITLTHWPMKFGQIPAYQDALKRFGKACRWIAYVDADEFFIPLQGESLPHILDSLGDISELSVPWTIFGSNGHDRRPRGCVLENFTQRAAHDFEINRHLKNIVRADAARPGVPSPHVVRLFRGRRIREDGVVLDEMDWRLPEPFTPTRLRLHHYVVQSRQDFENKQARGLAVPSDTRDDRYFNIHDRNEFEDKAALLHMPAIHDARALRDRQRRSPIRRLIARLRRVADRAAAQRSLEAQKPPI